MNTSKLDLNLLRVLHALLRERTTTGAASRLNLSQPAVSSALKRLRDNLGDPLFERKGRGLEPTPYAQSIEQDVYDLMDRLDDTFSREVRFDPAQTKRIFRLSASDFYADHLLPRLFSTIEDLAPHAGFQLLPIQSDDPLGPLDRFRADATICLEQRVPGWVRSAHAMSSRFKIIAGRGGFLQQAGLSDGDMLPFELYDAANHALYSPSGLMSTWVDEALAARGKKRHIKATTSTFNSLGRLVAETDLIATLPEFAADDLARIYPLQTFAHPLAAQSELMLAWHVRNDLKPDQRWFRKQILDALASLTTE